MILGRNVLSRTSRNQKGDFEDFGSFSVSNIDSPDRADSFARPACVCWSRYRSTLESSWPNQVDLESQNDLATKDSTPGGTNKAKHI